MDSDNTTNIIKYIIRNVPYGLLKETLEHLKVLVGQSALEEKEVQDELTLYEEEHLKHVNYNDEKVILSKHNKNEDNFYFDQSKKLKVSISALSENFDKLVNLEENEVPQNDFFNFISKLLNSYKQKNFENNISAASAYFKPLEENRWAIDMIVSAHKLNLHNFWTGEWLAVWNLEKVDVTSYVLKGSLKINTYYYEDGNVQFNLKQDFDKKLESDAENEEFAQEIIKTVENWENSIQTKLDDIFENLSNEYFKPLRRKLPIIGKKMDWNLHQVTFQHK